MKINFKRRKFLNRIGIAGIGLLVPEILFGLQKIELRKLYPLLIDAEGNPISTLDKWLIYRELIKKAGSISKLSIQFINYITEKWKTSNSLTMVRGTLFIQKQRRERMSGLIRIYKN